MIPSWAKPGAKVVCVDAEMVTGPSPLCVGGIYTVTFAYLCKGAPRGAFKGPHPCVVLAEVRNTFSPTRHGGFSADRFRPLAFRTQEQDVALFKSLLNPTLVDKLDLLAERMNELAED
jgi:hypothetical protein